MNSFFYIVFFILCLSHEAFSFGKNKIQYEKFDFEIFKTAHFDIYYNKGQEFLAREASLILEASAAHLTKNMRHELTQVLPVILYNSHNDFEQSNVTLELISEGTG